jgi:hypothetical protein
MYNSNEQKLVDSNIGYCLSAWNYPVPPSDVQFVPGLSPCAEWNHIVLIPSKCLHSIEFFFHNIELRLIFTHIWRKLNTD